ncbi:hypothetical protein C8Q74DRAFT_1371700 [Fomes fomentarius]|nr:hypothetical protein C8Q74DRAFT_1371700 [Fomes fomentarius]
MDELVRHCLRELSFDGDLGCDVLRLRDFIAEFYSHPSSSQAQGQNVDDAFCALVWSFIVQQPGVRVGTIPPGGSTEVYIAPQASAVRKAKAKAKANANAKGEEAVEEPEPRTGLNSVPDAAIRPLEDLKRQYGDQLRIAVDLETTFVALTGSHIRPSKLTAMVYTALQIISRGRENGVSVLDLGKKSGYDQKTCFYIIKQLVELGLVVKLRKPGVSGNMCVHKYFYERSPVWQQVVAEEQKAIAHEQDKDGQGDSEDDEDQEETKPLAPVHFDPIDSRHLSSMPVLKARLAKLLKNCPHHMHTSNNLMLKIGFVNPTRTDRRFFRTRLRELMEHGFIEKVHVPHANIKRHPDKKIPCIRLITDEEATPVPGEVDLVEDGDIQELEDAEATDTGLKVNVSLHRQIIDCLSEAGMRGMTLNELSAALGNFDKRTVDLLMNRLEKDPPPAHLADLGIAQLAETHGRERRYKYYTVAHYLAIAEKEQFEEQRYRDVDLSTVGGFLPVEPDVFYDDEAELHRRVGELSGLKDGAVSKGKGKKHVNPILPDGSVKKGRPRKSMQPEGTTPTPSKKGRKRKRDESEDAVDAASTSEPPPKKKRGRPPKVRPSEDAGADPSASTAPRKRGRSSKKRLDEGEADTVAGPSSVMPESVSQGPARKKRGRPRKSVAPAAQQAAIDEAERTEDVPMADWKSSSPLSSLTQSPVPEGTTIDVSGAVEAQVTTTAVDLVQPDSSFPISDASIEPAPTASASDGLRRSTRATKVRKRGDSLSPVRKSPRKPRKSTIAADASSAAVVPTTFSATQDVVPDPVISPQPAAVETPALTAPHSTLPDSISMPPPSFVPFYAGLQYDIPIDPALLQGDELSALIQGHTLIAMTPEPEAGPSNATDNSRKRGQLETPSAEPLSKRAKSGQPEGSSRFRTKANISQSRRENELLRLLAEADGIMNTSCKEFYEAHAALVEKITEAGETASTRPGARIDKRTLEATLKDLETKGKIKLVTTMAPTLTGSNRMARVAYLPDVSETALQVFLADLGQSLQNLQIGLNPAPVRTFDEPLAYGGGRKPPKGRPSRAREQTEGDVQEVVTIDMAQLFQQSDQMIRDALLSEKNTVAQLYGYIVGRAARARALHSLTVDMLSKGAPSSQIVSHDSRIVHLSYYSTDIPISTYCSLVAVLEPMEELGRLLRSPAGRTTLVRSVPEAVRAALAPAHAKSRTRILSLLELLQTLGLVTPLVPSTSPTPAFTCAPNVEYPTAFDVAPPGAHTTAAAPVYWRFNDLAPIRLWALGEGLPPAWKTVSVATSEQATAFWDDLERASTDADYARVLLGAAPAPSEHATEEALIVSKTLRRTVSWSSVYNLSLLQTEYLRRYIDPTTGNTPLDDPEHGDEQLERLSWIVSASKDVITRWFEKARKKHTRDLNKVKKRKRKADKHEEAGAVLARRAAAAKEQRERDWDAMVARVHPSELRPSAEQRVRRIKAKFISGSGKASEKWETRIADAIKEADMVAEKLLSTSRAPLFTHTPVVKPAPPPPVVTSVQEADVDDLIASQVPRAVKEASSSKKKKKSKKGKEKDTDDVDVKTPRRHRFLWNNQYDELARDASVIIKARCRGPTRLDWGAVEQVFPAVPRNSVRQRLVHMKEDTRVETYLARLEDKWYDLWMQHRGTDELPDPDPESATNFDLRTHIKFLRKHIDKNAIRVGFVEVRANVELPASIDDIEKHFDVAEKVPTAPPWDFMWTVVAEEAREKQFVHNAFTSEVADLPPVTSYDSDFLQVAEAAVKMALGNPTETYDADAGSQFLKAVGEEPVRLTTAELLSRGVLAKMIRDPTKSKPGRALKISDSNQNALGGPLASELFQDAAALDDLIAQQDGNERGQEWSLLASDGDTAFILELASENKVRFDIDTSHPQSMRAMIDWNSKKADDDDIETALRVRYANVAGPSSEPFVTEPIIEPSGSDRGVPSGMAADVSMYMDVDQSPGLARHEDACEHGQTADGEIAFCRRTSDGLVDCEACLEQAKMSLVRATDGEDERTAVAKVLGALHAAGSKGVTKQELLTKLDPVPKDTLFSVVQRMTDAAATAPLAYWTGYAAVVLVSAGAIRPWTVTVYNTESADSPGSAERKSMLFPRRWLDIYGRKLSEVWEAALRAVLGIVLLRPGISQADIRWRLRSVYDRDEVCEVLQTLQEARYITPRVDRVHRTFDGGPADEQEEKFTFWFLAGRRWYQV